VTRSIAAPAEEDFHRVSHLITNEILAPPSRGGTILLLSSKSNLKQKKVEGQTDRQRERDKEGEGFHDTGTPAFLSYRRGIGSENTSFVAARSIVIDDDYLICRSQFQGNRRRCFIGGSETGISAFVVYRLNG